MKPIARTVPNCLRSTLAAGLVTGGLLTSVLTGAGSAHADVEAVSLPAAAAIASRTITLTGTVQVASSTTGLHSAALWFTYPGAATATQVGSAVSRRPGFLVISGVIDATRITPGRNLLQVVDQTDGDRRTIVLDLRRKSRVSITSAVPVAGGRIQLAVRARHYDPKLGGYEASHLSPVRLQQKIDGAWTTIAAVVTDAKGVASTTVPAAIGTTSYRAVRPDGATVRAATSKAVTVGAQGGRMQVASAATTQLPNAS